MAQHGATEAIASESQFFGAAGRQMREASGDVGDVSIRVG